MMFNDAKAGNEKDKFSSPMPGDQTPITHEEQHLVDCVKAGTLEYLRVLKTLLEVDLTLVKGDSMIGSGRKNDAGKSRWSLLPWREIAQVVDVLTHGAKEYSDFNWQQLERPRQRYYDAAMRHLTSWWLGEAKDSKSGLPHLAHAVCCLLFLLWFDNEGENK